MRPFLIGIGGDSGSGKNTLSELIKDLIGEENILIVSMDGFHKWNREEMKKQTLTHLNPEANNLDLAQEQISILEKGKSVDMITYDHFTGKFTKPHKTTPKKFILITGLHPYHLRTMRDLFDFKIFTAPDEDIRKKWKIYRDMKKRGYKKDAVLDILAKRKADSIGYIHAQEQYADLVLNYFEIGDTKDIPKMKLGASFIFHDNPQSDLKLLRKFLSEKGLSATLEGKALTLTGEINKKNIAKLADIFFDNNDIFKNIPKWHDNMKGVFQLISAIEIDRRFQNNK